MSVNKLGIRSYEFGTFRLIPEEHLLLRSGEPVSLSPKVFEVLVCLVEQEGHLIKKNDLLDLLWADSFVEEATLTRTISSLRKALGETGDSKFIETVPKSGYRFTAPVRCVTENPVPPAILSSAFVQTNNGNASEPAVSNVSIIGSLRQIAPRPILLITLLSTFTVVAASIISWSLQTGSSKEIRSIAVLPFHQLGEGERDETLEFGMADTLIARLSNLKDIIVRPTRAVSGYVGQKPEADSVGRDLKVDAVLEGNIQKTGERVRVTVRLISTADGSSLWAEQFDTRSTDIFVVQDDISARIAQSLASELTGIEKERLAKRDTDNKEAYEAYIKGRYLWSRRNPADFKKSLDFFEQAIRLDPNYALAYTGAADCYQLFAVYRLMPVDEGFSKARNAAKKALEIDESLAEAHASLGYTLAFYDWNWSAAENEFKRAIELNPNYVTGRQWYSEYLRVVGRFDEARLEIERAQELDPLSPVINADIAAYFYLTRQYDNAISQSQKLLESEPGFAWAYWFLFLNYESKGMEDESIEAYLKAAELFFGTSKDEIEELKAAREQSGRKGFWEKRLEQMDRPSAKHIYLAWDHLVCHLRLGDNARILEWMERSYKDRDKWIIYIKHDPHFDHLRPDPRFQDLLRRIGL